MKVWVGYGSEHSANLVMIGRFEDAGDAAAAKRLIDRLTTLVAEEQEAGRMRIGEADERFSDQVLEVLGNEHFHSIGPAELEQFAYDVSVKHTGTTIELRTDEIDVSAFLKVLLDHKARVEVFSAHDHGQAKGD
jgi:hypothetical protein